MNDSAVCAEGLHVRVQALFIEKESWEEINIQEKATFTKKLPYQR